MSPDRGTSTGPRPTVPSERPLLVGAGSSGPLLRRRHLLRGALGLGAFGATLTACGGTGPETDLAAPATPAASDADGTVDDAIGHVHAAAYAPDGTGVLLATHAGLYTVAANPDRAGTKITRVGAPIDLMGFTVAPDGAYLASGHPGPGLGLPQPLGLARSTDRGRTWRVLSRGGESDFHALAVSTRGAIGYDGTLRFSRDLRTWQSRSIPAPPRMLSAHPGTGQVLATTAAGLLRSVDDGHSWTRLTPPALVSDAVWADADTIVGVTTAQVLVLSRDRGTTWQSGPGPVASPAGGGPLEPVAALACRHTPETPSTSPPSSGTPRSTGAGGPAHTPEVLVVFGHVPLVTHDLGASSELVR